MMMMILLKQGIIQKVLYELHPMVVLVLNLAIMVVLS